MMRVTGAGSPAEEHGPGRDVAADNVIMRGLNARL